MVKNCPCGRKDDFIHTPVVNCEPNFAWLAHYLAQHPKKKFLNFVCAIIVIVLLLVTMLAGIAIIVFIAAIMLKSWP